MKLYHASEILFEVGGTVGPFSSSSLFTRNAELIGFIAAENAIEARRPSAKRSRQAAVFAFAEPGQCLAYSWAEGVESPRLYEVCMQEPSACPMALVETIRSSHLKGHSCDRLIDEYWNPSQSWRFVEYFAPSFRVIARLKVDDHTVDGHAAREAYQHDRKRAKALAVKAL